MHFLTYSFIVGRVKSSSNRKASLTRTCLNRKTTLLSKVNFFVCFLEELRISKSPFEINRPLDQEASFLPLLHSVCLSLFCGDKESNILLVACQIFHFGDFEFWKKRNLIIFFSHFIKNKNRYWLNTQN